MFSTGVLRGHEGSPLVIDDTMYLHTPFPNKVFAIDLDTQKIKWKYEPKQDPAVIPQMCCDTVNRGPRLCRGQDLPAAGRQHAGRARRQDRQGGLVREERRSEGRRGQHQCAARLQGQGHHRHHRRRVGRARLPRGLRHQHRQAGLEGLQHRAGRRDADRSRQDDDLDRRRDEAGRQGLVAEDLAGRSVEDRRRHDLGLVQLRQGAQPAVLRHRQSRRPGIRRSVPATTSGR